MTAEFDPSDYPGEVVHALVAICAEQGLPSCAVKSEPFYEGDYSIGSLLGQWPSPWPPEFGTWLESKGWVYNDEGWTCPTCMAALLKEAEEDDE